jgi:hypothetical protein
VAGGRRSAAGLLAPRSAVVDAGVRDPLDGHRLCPLFLGPGWEPAPQPSACRIRGLPGPRPGPPGRLRRRPWLACP